MNRRRESQPLGALDRTDQLPSLTLVLNLGSPRPPLLSYLLYCHLLCFKGSEVQVRFTHIIGILCSDLLVETHTHARARIDTHTHTHARPRARTHERTHARTHAHTHTHTHKRLRSWASPRENSFIPTWPEEAVNYTSAESAVTALKEKLDTFSNRLGYGLNPRKYRRELRFLMT